MDVITFGETMVLFSSNNHLPLEYVDQLKKQIGGSESNVAIGLSRQGHSVGWFSKVGKDPFGRYVANTIRGEGVDTSHCIVTDQAPTGVFFKEKKTQTQTNIFYYRSHSAASLLVPEDIDEDYISQAKIMHITGITPAISLSARETVFKAIEIAKRHNIIISFDPNIRLKLWDKEEAKEVLLKIAEQADYILTGIDEGNLLTEEKTPEAIAFHLQKLNSGVVVIKLGEQGAFYSTVDISDYVPGYPASSVIDPVGAGDGFASGFLSGILQGESLEQAVKRGNAVGASIVQYNGDFEGLPTREEVNNIMNYNLPNTDVMR